MFTAVEIFAGGGGLALGLRRGGALPVAAVELNRHAADTFSKNHPDVTLFNKDIREVSGDALLSASPTSRIDILAACPPCQGFSSLTSKYKRDDYRNTLVEEVGRIAEETRPLAIMMENVPGLAKRGRPILDTLISRLESLGYECRWSILQVADYGVPQMRRRLVLLAGRGFAIDMPEPTHSKIMTRGLPPWRTVRDAIEGSKVPLPLDQAIGLGGGSEVNWNVVRRLGLNNIARLALAEPGKTQADIPMAVRPKCHQNNEGKFRNTYGRLEWDKPSSTITAGCLSPSKGRFGHPDELRTISLREAATLQTFPENYVFETKHIDKACSIVGNALPCLFAQKITERVIATLNRVLPWLPEQPRPVDFQ